MPNIERAMPQDNAGMVKLVYTTDSKIPKLLIYKEFLWKASIFIGAFLYSEYVKIQPPSHFKITLLNFVYFSFTDNFLSNFNIEQQNQNLSFTSHYGQSSKPKSVTVFSIWNTFKARWLDVQDSKIEKVLSCYCRMEK